MDKALAQDALHMLREYYLYSEEMRKIGRGFHPTGYRGHSVESILMRLQSVVGKED